MAGVFRGSRSAFLGLLSTEAVGDVSIGTVAPTGGAILIPPDVLADIVCVKIDDDSVLVSGVYVVTVVVVEILVVVVVVVVVVVMAVLVVVVVVVVASGVFPVVDRVDIRDERLTLLVIVVVVDVGVVELGILVVDVAFHEDVVS